MLTQEVLERYFDRLLQTSSAAIDPNYALADDAAREERMHGFQTQAATLAAMLAHFARVVRGKHPDCAHNTQRLSEAFSRHALQNIQDFSDQLRECAVNMVLSEQMAGTSAAQKTSLSERYFSTQGVEEHLWTRVSTDILQVGESQKKWFSFGKLEGVSAEEIAQILTLLSGLESELYALYQGVLSHDKRMLEMLRLLKTAMKGQMVAMAAEHTLASKVGKGASFSRMASILNQEMQHREQDIRREEQEQIRAAQQAIGAPDKDRGRGV